MRGTGIRRMGGDVEVLDLPGSRALAADEVLVGVVAAGIGNGDEPGKGFVPFRASQVRTR